MPSKRNRMTNGGNCERCGTNGEPDPVGHSDRSPRRSVAFLAAISGYSRPGFPPFPGRGSSIPVERLAGSGPGAQERLQSQIRYFGHPDASERLYGARTAGFVRDLPWNSKSRRRFSCCCSFEKCPFRWRWKRAPLKLCAAHIRFGQIKKGSFPRTPKKRTT